MYLVPGGTWSGGVPGPRGGVYLVLGGVPGPRGGTWARGGVPGPGGMYLVLGGVPGPGGVPGGGVPGQVLPPCEQNHTHL